MTDRNVIRERMELIGETEVRRQLQAGNIPADEIAFVQRWLGEKEAFTKALHAESTSAAASQARSAATANVLATAALLISLVSLFVGLAALFREH